MALRYKTVNINTQENVSFTLFPDNQPHITLKNINAGDMVNVVCSILSPNDLIYLLEVSETIQDLRAYKNTLVIPYLMSARYDRHMVDGDSFDLKIFSNLINSLGFIKVELIDVHSEVSLHMIYKSHNTIPNLLELSSHSPMLNDHDVIYICPDKGASKRVSSLAKGDIVICEKTRDSLTGFITLTVLKPKKCEGRHCVVIDDICDGGRTFVEIAKQINPAYLVLVVTHGIFSKGVRELKKHYNHIITSDSRTLEYDIVKHIEIVKLGFNNFKENK